MRFLNTLGIEATIVSPIIPPPMPVITETKIHRNALSKYPAFIAAFIPTITNIPRPMESHTVISLVLYQLLFIFFKILYFLLIAYSNVKVSMQVNIAVNVYIEFRNIAGGVFPKIRSRRSPPPTAQTVPSTTAPNISSFFSIAKTAPDMAKAIVPISSKTKKRLFNKN